MSDGICGGFIERSLLRNRLYVTTCTTQPLHLSQPRFPGLRCGTPLLKSSIVPRNLPLPYLPTALSRFLSKHVPLLTFGGSWVLQGRTACQRCDHDDNQGLALSGRQAATPAASTPAATPAAPAAAGAVLVQIMRGRSRKRGESVWREGVGFGGGTGTTRLRFQCFAGETIVGPQREECKGARRYNPLRHKVT